ncbi:putative diacylglycerol kinase, catalytic domain, inorganic polyphosphate/ATP-NAD kinase [Septoria linicola]|nr:putative diacylglycerol kinase, catalytic domain, inorganic polyphosphate/ATP-NAD kinase [Septoria linicola]
MDDTANTTRSNPFDDPDPDPDHAPSETSSSSSSPADSAVLTVDRNATLTLGTDSLIVLDEGLRHRRSAANCCGLLPQFGKTTRAIPFHNVLWASLDEQTFQLNIRYAQPVGRKGKSCRVDLINYCVTDKTLYSHARHWAKRLQDRAYPAQTKKKKRIKVLVNPFGGTGIAQRLWTREVQPVLEAAQCIVDEERTTYRGHAIEIAEKLDIEAYDVVACASGDGLPHEVFNGLARRKDARRALRKIAVVQIPCGSGNAMSLNLNGTDQPSLAAVEIVKGIRTPLDLVAITQGDTKIYSFLSQAVGVIADTDLGTESLRWMGSFRFTWGIIVRMLGQTIYPAEVSVLTATDDKRAIKEQFRHTREEYEAAKLKNLRPSLRVDKEDHNPEDSLGLPPLQYGTATDALPTSFTTTDMPKLGNFYVGNMCYMSPDAPFFACALPADGRMDMIAIAGNIKRSTCLRMLVKVEDGSIINFPEAAYSKVLAYRITPRAAPIPPQKLGPKFRRWLGGTAGGIGDEGLIAIDGERIPFEPFQAEIVPGLGTVLSRSGSVYEFQGPKSL